MQAVAMTAKPPIMLPCGHSPMAPETCRLCNLYETDPKFRLLWDSQKPPLPIGRGSITGNTKQPASKVSCVDTGTELLAGRAAELGLDTRCRWFACKTGEHVAHRSCAKVK